MTEIHKIECRHCGHFVDAPAPPTPHVEGEGLAEPLTWRPSVDELAAIEARATAPPARNWGNVAAQDRCDLLAEIAHLTAERDHLASECAWLTGERNMFRHQGERVRAQRDRLASELEELRPPSPVSESGGEAR